jgi:deoxyribodipyrimidine photolyase-related protein
MAEPALLHPALPAKVRHLVIVRGNLLDAQSSALEGFDATKDGVWMAKVAEVSPHAWSGSSVLRCS